MPVPHRHGPETPYMEISEERQVVDGEVGEERGEEGMVGGQGF